MKTSLLALLSLPFAAAAADPVKITLLNPSLDVAGNPAAGWDGKWADVSISRDTTVFHSAPASLCADRSGKGQGSGSSSQMIAAPGGVKFRIGGWLRTEGHAKVSFAVQSFDAKYTAINFQQVKFAMNDTDWSYGEKEVTLPPNAAKFAVTLLVEGDGKAWLDDVKIESDSLPVETRNPEPPSPDEIKPEEPNDPKAIPVTPVRGFYPNFPSAWIGIHRTQLERVKKAAGPLDILLLGDSITLGWGNGWDAGDNNRKNREVWERAFGKYKTLNLGIGGDATQNVLWRMQNGEVDGLQPRLVVLAIGVNNVWNWAAPPSAVAQGVKACVDEIRSRLPRAKVLVVNVFPNQETPDSPNRRRTEEVRAEIRKLNLDEGGNVHFADFGDRFLQQGGKIAKETMGDFLHPTAKGYEIYAAQLEPFVNSMLR